jgi:F0F1-type ATP synthase assembly protein I
MPEPGGEPSQGWASTDPGGAADQPGFGVPPAPPRFARWKPEVPHSRDVLSAIVVAIALVVVGVPMGLIWGATTPKLDVKQALAGSEAAFNVQGGADVHFALLALIFGVVAGAVVGWIGRRGSWTLPLALAVGGVGGSLVAAQVGHLQESSSVLDQLPQDIRSRVSDIADFTLRSHGFHVVFPVAALLTYLAIMLATSRAEQPALPETPEPDRYWSVPH